MQISPNRPTAYPKASQPNTAQRPATKFAGNQKLTTQELDQVHKAYALQQDFLKSELVNPFHTESYDTLMGELKPTFKNKTKYVDEHKNALTFLQNQSKEVAQKRAAQHEQLIATINASQPEAETTATTNTQSQPAPAAQPTNEPSAVPPANPSSSGGEQPTQIENTPKFRPREERTRTNVAGDVIKQYFVGRSKKIWWDLGLSTGIGAIFAIGSPVMAVTIPTTMGIIGAYRLTQLAFKMMRSPKGDNINDMYKKWEEKEAEAAKEANQSN